MHVVALYTFAQTIKSSDYTHTTSVGRRCVVCGQPVSRRMRKARASVRALSTDDCLDVAEVCPVCDCRLTPDEQVVFSNAACCMSAADVASRLA